MQTSVKANEQTASSMRGTLKAWIRPDLKNKPCNVVNNLGLQIFDSNLRTANITSLAPQANRVYKKDTMQTKEPLKPIPQVCDWLAKGSTTPAQPGKYEASSIVKNSYNARLKHMRTLRSNVCREGDDWFSFRRRLRLLGPCHKSLIVPQPRIKPTAHDFGSARLQRIEIRRC